ncbi:MAG: hypothetical protein ACLPLP_22650 [Mycobacterium sp.]
MDINVALAIARREVQAFHSGRVVDMSALVDAIASIDAWLSRGGFLPTAWATHNRHTMIRAVK